ncbi:ADP-glyceromanno-heptose 6-epimerase [Campylobacter sp. MIT 12-8780]|uniref:ADP-glyceromanno-heptose 6-epimerase n=1 Tax=unclassified Campylobacter TaxID=2593542 RepID=UPI0010F996A6|nr:MULTISPECIES: ADP-glyceromanno-heptose 6-epimerase [unclassified Campylobacter]NDJ26790.1 ADP-glyceromanno-heptose 6-epimerase [Campylobacter sp. MIT 19-121]TKX30140.1 ADP-glyceromanno-heptose 6-epimerase [Campylobacter sp. MIT 12-5580]TQR42389.1 ADP-glyceromanno-heptose 6-epimerase [Campylobacter sp. MIT 12-8780]
MKIVITGGAGFIGSQLALALQDKHEILVIDKMRNEEKFSNGNLKSLGHFKNLLGFKGELFVGDINEPCVFEKIEDFKAEVIFHQAAISDTTADDESLILRTNLNSFKNFIDLSIKLKARLIYASSASVYGDAVSPQIVGKDEMPKNPYAFSKLMMDHLAFKYSQKLDIVGLRYFNVYGKGEFFKGKTASMILQFGLQILSGQNPRLFEGSEKIFRDFVYIKDVINANLKALEAKSGVYNVATSIPRSFQDIVDILQIELGTTLPCEYIKNPYAKAYQFHTQADLSNWGGLYEPKFSLEEGIKDYISEIKRIHEKEVNA